MTPPRGTNGATKAPQEPAGERANGTPTTTPTLPVDSYRDAAVHLRRPFTPAAVKFKVQATWPKDNPQSALIVAYIDARLAIERLNLVCPHLWHEGGADPSEPPYQAAAGGLLCRLTVDGLTRADVGEGQGKGLVSDAFKRAAVHFGVGVSLYATPKMILSAQRDSGSLKPDRGRDGKATLKLTDAGEARCRQLYADWLEQHGTKAFGEPLDHGDLVDAIGDADVDDLAPADEGAPSGNDAPPAPASAPPAEPEENHEEALAALLAEEGPLQKKRRAADNGMQRMGASARKRLASLRQAGDDEKQLDALIVRISNALDGGGEK